MKKRAISLLLALTVLFALLPTSVGSVAVTEQQLKQQIRDTYRTAIRRSGKESFNGFCGSLVSWQTYLLGIDDSTHNRNGKDAFDQYRYRDMTCGGYRVKAYPASKYTLKEALNAITHNGTADAYNILVGFQKTNTTEGQIYGHAMFIHGIVDGVVYFMECYDSGLGGGYYPEGSPISCSIDTFCRYYNSWTVFDGVAYFGIKTYADMCTAYPASLTAMTFTATDLWQDPVDEGVNDQDVPVVTPLSKGEMVQVTRLLKTPGGAYWYEAQWENQQGYIPADKVIAAGSSDVGAQLVSPKVPGALRKSYGFVLGGTVTPRNSILKQVTVQVVDSANAVRCEATVKTDASQFSLNTSAIDRNMIFRKLPVGNYRVVVSAQVETYVYENSEAVSKQYTVDVWDSAFQVVGDWGKYYTLTFNPNGGKNTLDAKTVAKSAAAGQLPTPERAGYTFKGWYTKPDGGEQVTESTSITANRTLYARWEESLSGISGWHHSSSGWLYLEKGVPADGWFLWKGIWFYQKANQKPISGWAEIDGKRYFLSGVGMVETGWLEHNGHTHYLQENGASAEGWLWMDDHYYYFNDDGVMQTGWLEIDGEVYYLDENGCRVTGEIVLDGRKYRFQEDGTLRTGWVQKSGKVMYLDAEGNAVTGWQNIDGVVCYFGTDGELYLTATGSGDYCSLMNNIF